MALAAISIDLDSLPHYCRIQGLPESLLDARARGLVYEVALARFGELLTRLGLPVTLFAIGEDLASPAAAGTLRTFHRSGAEIGNHSHTHDYALSHRPKQEIAGDLERAEQAIHAAVGETPRGFRAPGYTLSPTLYQVLCDRGYAYDSSAFPAAPYYAAKATVMGALALLGRPSRSVLDTPKVLLAPRDAYWPDPSQPYRRGQGAVLELPITTAPVTRVPFFGTLATMFPPPVVRAIYRTLRGTPLFNFELHGIDVLDADDGIPAELARQQRDLRIPHATKLTRLASVFQWLRDDFEVVTLGEAARRSARAG